MSMLNIKIYELQPIFLTAKSYPLFIIPLTNIQSFLHGPSTLFYVLKTH